MSECLAWSISEHTNFHERYKLDCTRVAYNILCDLMIINYNWNLKCIFITNFEIKMLDIRVEIKLVDIRDVIVSKAAVYGLRYANCVPFLVIVYVNINTLLF